MQYRTMRFQKTEDRVSLLAFGCMRFPKTESGAIDRERAGKMLDTAVKAGVNKTVGKSMPADRFHAFRNLRRKQRSVAGKGPAANSGNSLRPVPGA